METTTILTRLLGNLTTADYLIYFIFIALGVTASIRLQARNRNKMSECTPYHFSFKFFILDNLPRAVGSIIVVFLIIRFWNEYTKTSISELQATLIGLCYDLIKDAFNQLKEKYKNRIRETFK
jgi:ABC-type Mn2+/Zn2+ transport system permease subunit